MKYSIAIVTWGDAYINAVDIPLEDAMELQPLMRVTVGFLINMTEDAYILCTDHYESDGQWIHAPMCIPRNMVKEIRTFPEE